MHSHGLLLFRGGFKVWGSFGVLIVLRARRVRNGNGAKDLMDTLFTFLFSNSHLRPLKEETRIVNCCCAPVTLRGNPLATVAPACPSARQINYAGGFAIVRRHCVFRFYLCPLLILPSTSTQRGSSQFRISRILEERRSSPIFPREIFPRALRAPISMSILHQGSNAKRG